MKLTLIVVVPWLSLSPRILSWSPFIQNHQCACLWVWLQSIACTLIALTLTAMLEGCLVENTKGWKTTSQPRTDFTVLARRAHICAKGWMNLNPPPPITKGLFHLFCCLWTRLSTIIEMAAVNSSCNKFWKKNISKSISRLHNFPQWVRLFPEEEDYKVLQPPSFASGKARKTPGGVLGSWVRCKNPDQYT